MSLWRSDTPITARSNFDAINANMATLDQIKEVLWGETDKINLKLDKLTANFKELCKTVKLLNDKYDEHLKPAGKKY